MKSLLRTITVTFVLAVALCINVNATITLKDDVLTFTGENFSSFYNTSYRTSYSEQMRRHTEYWSFADHTLVCIDGYNNHRSTEFTTYDLYPSESNMRLPQFTINGTTYWTQLNGDLGTVNPKTITFSRPTGQQATTILYATCDDCRQFVRLTNPRTAYIWNGTTTLASTSGYKYTMTTTYKEVQVKNCTSTGTYPSTSNSPAKTFTLSSHHTTVNGGNYTGQPAFNSSNVTIVKGTITDTDSTTSTFLLGEDSEATVTTSGTKTV